MGSLHACMHDPASGRILGFLLNAYSHCAPDDLIHLVLVPQ